MPALDHADLATSIVQLRHAIVKTRDSEVRAALREVEVRLRRALGPTIPKKKAAAVLGISVTALDRWVERGFLPVVERPGSSRHELESRPFLELAAQVARLRLDGAVARGRVAPAVERLGWTPMTGGRRVLRLDVAALPRPNITEQELVANFRSTTPEQRVREAAELSRFLVRPGASTERAA
jgi:hypothetical protein